MEKISSYCTRLWLALLLASVISLAAPTEAQSNSDLERTLGEMDKASSSFRTTEAEFVWQQYTSLVKETDTQKGKIYFRRSGDEIQTAVDLTEPYPKYVLLTGGKLQFFEPQVDRVTVYDLSKNHGEFETFLVLGFGGGGHSMAKSFDVKYADTEKLNGIETSKLDLVPKSAKIRNTFEHILLWIDPARGVSVQQQLFQPGGDYRLVLYSNIQINPKIADSVFKLKTDAKTSIQTVSSSHE
jgi:outer membrane lipoprotein-sorting protein